jgi:predicted nucleotidyltransferase
MIKSSFAKCLFQIIDYLCDMGKKEKILNSIKKFAELNYPDAEIFLFGSRARNTSNKNSDWDVLIILNLNTIPFEQEVSIMDSIYDIELESGEVISPLIYSKADWYQNRAITPLFHNVNKYGIRLL